MRTKNIGLCYFIVVIVVVVLSSAFVCSLPHRINLEAIRLLLPNLIIVSGNRY